MADACPICKRVDGHVSSCELGHEVRTGRTVVENNGGVMESRFETDQVNHPGHYTFGAIEVIDAIEAWGLGFHDGNVVKYVARARHKGTELQDLKKARWYLDRLIAAREKEQP